jgi:hypothetical protein
MGSFDPPGTTYHPGLRENLYGKFTVNLGVYVPEVAASHGGGAAKDWVREYHCCIRSRLGELGTEQTDVWWSIGQEKRVVEDLLPRIRHDAMFFFARYESRDLILKELTGQTENMGAGGPPRIICAIILASRGEVTSHANCFPNRPKKLEIRVTQRTFEAWLKNWDLARSSNGMSLPNPGSGFLATGSL